ncbi:MAG: phosphoribosylformylglycinamidine synthase subunit PurQ [Chitinophagia bacterium]|nr:phosphoribosylformylglycinamidine synthase subunit PurQ [Chitinophagia bacterium]
MKYGIVVFPGSNCDRDMMHALKYELKQNVEYLWHKDSNLSHFDSTDCIVLPGGFSFGDYLRCGAIARFSPIMEQVISFAQAGGKVLGVCNGFQVLCEAGLLPGTLLKNAHQQFVCKNIHLKYEPDTATATHRHILKIPVAHGEGRYYAPAHTMQALQDNNQILFTYTDSHGKHHLEANPNGSVLNIAGICNEQGNVVGMMPHPERACSPSLHNMDGKQILLGFNNPHHRFIY